MLGGDGDGNVASVWHSRELDSCNLGTGDGFWVINHREAEGLDGDFQIFARDAS